jgi:alpha-beta hydrolase superfamily lysophospholipase
VHLPLILLGHSLGGLVVSRFVALGIRPVEGLVMSSPALDAGLNPLQKLLLAFMPKLAPDLCVGNGLDARYLSHDGSGQKIPRRPAGAQQDLAPLGKFIATAGPATVAAAAAGARPRC